MLPINPGYSPHHVGDQDTYFVCLNNESRGDCSNLATFFRSFLFLPKEEAKRLSRHVSWGGLVYSSPPCWLYGPTYTCLKLWLQLWMLPDAEQLFDVSIHSGAYPGRISRGNPECAGWSGGFFASSSVKQRGAVLRTVATSPLLLLRFIYQHLHNRRCSHVILERETEHWACLKPFQQQNLCLLLHLCLHEVRDIATRTRCCSTQRPIVTHQMKWFIFHDVKSSCCCWLRESAVICACVFWQSETSPSIIYHKYF